MHTFTRNLITEWRRLELAAAGETVVVGVSGGADSVSLLLGLCDLRERGKLEHRIVAAHFNHRLRDGESGADEQFVRELAVRLGVELAVGTAGPAAVGNLEQNARDARYSFLSATAVNVKAFAVLTGHTVNDQAETFLLNLLRGSGVKGLSGMQAIRELKSGGVEESRSRRVMEPEGGGVGELTNVGASDVDGKALPYFPTPPLPDSPTPQLPFSSTPVHLARPLLRWAKRIDTEAFCRDSGVEYRYDTMNEDTAFKRVRIRKILLPLLEDMNPNIVEVLSNTAALMQRFCDDSRPADHLIAGDGLAITDVKMLSEAALRDTVRSWLARRRGNTRRLTLKHIEAVARLILSPKSGRIAELPGGRVVKTGGQLLYEETKG
ncbi:MAG: tRNA lysidine(34) synthetase TilS [Pyrinomonadaceae bacterium]